jgi:hypothetical protein
MTTAQAIVHTLESPNVADSNLEPANVVDVIDHLSRSARRIADAITPNITGGKDEAGGHVESLTEAVMGMTNGLCRIASSIESLAEAVRGSED